MCQSKIRDLRGVDTRSFVDPRSLRADLSGSLIGVACFLRGDHASDLGGRRNPSGRKRPRDKGPREESEHELDEIEAPILRQDQPKVEAQDGRAVKRPFQEPSQ